MSSGRQPARLAAILSLFGPVADEIIVAVEEPRARDLHAAVTHVADRVLSFPPRQPIYRPLPWLFAACTSDWILNIDDDEVPSERLIESLPRIVARDDITHAWIQRRWLYPTTAEYLDEAPWNRDFQLRLFLPDSRFTQFTDVLHVPFVAHGPGIYVDAPLWHLDTAQNDASRRHAKAEAYELARPGMRMSGLSQNRALYVPELMQGPRVAPVPPIDQMRIERVLSGALDNRREGRAAFVAGAAEEIDSLWPGVPDPDTLHAGQISVTSVPRSLTAGVQETIDVTVTNDGDRVWHWGREASPSIRLAYRWSRDGATVPEPIALRTMLPVDIAPGATELVPVGVVPPREPGRYALELEIVHEGVGRFASTPPLEIAVTARQTIALVGERDRVMRLLARLAAAPSVEPVIVLGNSSDRSIYGDYACVPGLRGPLLEGLEGAHGVALAARLAWRSLSLVRLARRHRRSGATGNTRLDTLFDTLQKTDALFVAGTDWPEDAAAGREWWRLAITILVARASGCPVYVTEHAVPKGHRVRDAVFRRLIRRTSTPLGDMTLRPASSPFVPVGEADGTEGADRLTRALA